LIWDSQTSSGKESEKNNDETKMLSGRKKTKSMIPKNAFLLAQAKHHAHHIISLPFLLFFHSFGIVGPSSR
jgi:hypothetical protein